VLQHLRRFGQALNGRRLLWIELGRRDLDALLQRFGEHGGAHTLRPGLAQLLAHVVHLVLGEVLAEALVQVEHETVLLHLIVVLAAQRGHLCDGARMDARIAHVRVLLPHQRLLLHRRHWWHVGRIELVVGHCERGGKIPLATKYII
jgi:hypothetical protein